MRSLKQRLPIALAVLALGCTEPFAKSSTLAIQADYQYGASVAIGFVRPVYLCGEVVAAVPLRNAARDTMFVAFGGIPNGAVC